MSNDLTAWRNGEFIPFSDLAFSPFDIGLLQGAFGVERARTWNGRCRTLELNLQRLQRTADVLGITDLPDFDSWIAAVDRIIETSDQNHELAFTLLISPGESLNGPPTFIAFAQRLETERFARLANEGQPLVVSSYQQPAPECWPRGIKTRSRLHYFLADQHAQKQQTGSLAVLLDVDGTVTETSTSNLHLVSGTTLILPPEDRVLPGVMSATLVRLLEDAGWSILRTPISVDQLRSAPEVWLTGSLGGLWPANSVDGVGKPLSTSLRNWQSKLLKYLSAE